MTTNIQRSFTAGEIAPQLYARADQVKYATGLRTCRNFYTMRHGGVTNRPGTKFIQEVADSANVIRLIPFIFNSSQTYVLEFGPLTIRVIKDGVQQREASKTITGVSAATPAVVTTSGVHGYTTGDEVYIENVAGISNINGRNFKVTVLTTTTYELQYMDNTNFTAVGTYTSGGSSAKVYEIASPYAAADLAEIHYVQSGDVITLVHPSYEPRDLSRTGDISWSLDVIDFKPSMTHPTGGSVAAGPAGSDTYKYKVTAIKSETLEESLPAIEATKTITGVTQANPAVVTTSASHGYTDGDTVLIESVVGMTELNDRRFTIANASGSTFELVGEDSSGYTAYSSGGTVGREELYLTSAGTPTIASPHVVSWTAVTGAVEYDVYREDNGIFGFIGTARGTSFDDADVDPDLTTTPPEYRNPFFGTGNYPSDVGYHQQRRIFANTDNEPEKVWASRTGRYENFTRSSPIRDDDSLTWTMAGNQVNEITNMFTLNGKLIMLTVDGEWTVEGNAAGVLVPGEVNPVQQTFNGSDQLQPVIVNDTALYLQSRQSIIRDVRFDALEVDGYRGNDLTNFSAHLFDNYTVSDWAYQQVPHSIVWVVRSDGKLLGNTNIRDQEILSWHIHDFEGGTVENCIVVPEGGEDVLYLAIKRTDIDDTGTSRTVRYIERLTNRNYSDVKDAVFTDASVTVDGRHTGSTTMTLSGGTDWDHLETLTLTASASTFSAGDTVNEIHLTSNDGEDLIRFDITGYTSPTVVTGKVNRTVPTDMRNVALTTWGEAVATVNGLWHLEGQEVSAFGDAYVAASANNDAYSTVTVTNGAAVFDQHYVTIHVGKPITSDIETLDIDSIRGETLVDKKINITKITAYLQDSYGYWAGSQPPSDDTVDPLEDLYETKTRTNEGYDSPQALLTGPEDVKIKGNYSKGGRVFIRQVDPSPLSILAISPSGYIPYRGA